MTVVWIFFLSLVSCSIFEEQYGKLYGGSMVSQNTMQNGYHTMEETEMLIK